MCAPGARQPPRSGNSRQKETCNSRGKMGKTDDPVGNQTKVHDCACGYP